MLYTNLQHIDNALQFQEIVAQNEKVVVACGRMDPTSIAIYNALDLLKESYLGVKFFDFECNNPEFEIVWPEIASSLNPSVVFIHNGEIKKVASGEVSEELFSDYLNEIFTKN